MADELVYKDRNERPLEIPRPGKHLRIRDKGEKEFQAILMLQTYDQFDKVRCEDDLLDGEHERNVNKIPW